MEKNLRNKKAKSVLFKGFLANVFLTIGKLLAGFFGNSQAMIADGIHSLSDLTTDVVVMLGFRISSKPEDEDHPYGHGKFETISTVFIAIMLFLAGLSILKTGFSTLLAFVGGEPLTQPKPLALMAALVSILVKEILYHVTLRVGKSIDSASVKANAWHHRSDAFSSLGTFVGIGLAVLLGNQWVVMDPIASMLVSFMIFKVAFEIFMPAVNELLEQSLPQEEMDYIESVLEAENEVMAYHEVRGRKLSNRSVIEFHMMVEPEMNITQAHNIATSVEYKLYEHFGRDSIITIHIEPYCVHEVKYYEALKKS